MDQQPASAATRPGVVTTVAVLMFIGGGFACLGGILAVTGGGMLVGYGGGLLILFGFLWIAIGAIEIWAGLGIMKLQERARMIGVVIAGVSAVLTLINIISGAPVGILSLAIDGFIIWALTTNKQLFA
jgi:hypothetical protein